MQRLSLVRTPPASLPISSSNSRIQVKQGDRWILMGTSGSGKTTALKYLDAVYSKLYPQSRHYVLDSKHDGDFDRFPSLVGGDSCPKPPGRNQRYQVWQPLKIIPDAVEEWLWNIRQDAPAILEVDELVHLCYKKGIYSDEYNILLKTGRSLPVATISLTQELSRIPPNAFNQSNHRLGFLLEGRYNRLIWRDLLKAEKYTEPVDHYGVYYQHINGRGEPRYYQDIQAFLGID